ncbi:MAG: 50S ribosomal protein L10 [Planctomycetota bacterium]
MSKYVKNLVSDDIKKRLQSVNDALLVNMVGMNSSSSYMLRKELRANKINILVVKNSLAARATAGTPLARLFDGVGGSAAICWGSEDIVALAKSITKILKSEKFPAFQPRGGVMDGEQISADQVAEVAKWPNRMEQLSLLLGQILSVGSRLNGQLIAVGGALASQIAERAKGDEEAATPEDAPPADAASGPECLPPTDLPPAEVPSADGASAT